MFNFIFGCKIEGVWDFFYIVLRGKILINGYKFKEDKYFSNGISCFEDL